MKAIPCRICGILLLLFVMSPAWHGRTYAGIIEVGDLNIIDDAGNPSDGLRFLDMSYSDGLTQAAAIVNAQLTYPNARLATPSEFDDLFAAAGIAYDGLLTASDGFSSGPSVTISSGANYDTGTLRDLLGYTVADFTLIWTDPDGSDSVVGTRDYLDLTASDASITQITITPSQIDFGWLLVSEASEVVPEPSSVTLMCLGAAALLARGGWRRKRRRGSET